GRGRSPTPSSRTVTTNRPSWTPVATAMRPGASAAGYAWTTAFVTASLVAVAIARSVSSAAPAWRASSRTARRARPGAAGTASNTQAAAITDGHARAARRRRPVRSRTGVGVLRRSRGVADLLDHEVRVVALDHDLAL